MLCVMWWPRDEFEKALCNQNKTHGVWLPCPHVLCPYSPLAKVTTLQSWFVQGFLMVLGSHEITDEIWLSCPAGIFGELLQFVKIQHGHLGRRQIITFSIIKLDSCAIPSFRTNLTSWIHFWHYLCDPRSKSRSNVTFMLIKAHEYAVFDGVAYEIIWDAP